MPANPIKIGPFVGGMNTYSGSSSISDNEAVDILNMDIDLDGSLSSRPGLQALATLVAATGPSHVLGTYRSTTDVVYLIIAHTNGVYAYNTSTSTPTLIQAGDFTAAVQYADKMYLVQRPFGSAVGGGKWDNVGGYVAVATMPRGMSAAIYKERMWIAGSRNNNQTSMNRLFFSSPGNPDTWNTATDTIDVASGDGEDIQKIYVYDSAIAIFKSDSTYVLAYDSAPTKAQVQKVSALGANNRFSVVEYENNLFVFHEGKVYRISNWNWEHANIKVPFKYSNTNSSSPENGTSLSVVNNRIICRFYDNYYTLGLKTGAWARWTFANSFPSEFVADPNVNPTYGATFYYAGSTADNDTYYRTIDLPLFDESVEINLITKDYDFGPSYGFKRLFWWGADLLSKADSTFYVRPVVYGPAVTWGQVGAVPISALGTWGRPLDVSLNVTDTASGSNNIGYRTFIKLLKGLRFRQVSFRLNAVVQASAEPYRIFSLTAFVDNKQQVTKKVS